MSTFFRNVNANNQRSLPPNSPIHSLKARAVLIDMEDTVLNETLRTPGLGQLFTNHQILTSTESSGSGNNWACGYQFYGDKYGDDMVESVRREAEQCDSLQSFFITHSTGGGTGSGFGSKVIETLADEYLGVYKFAVSVLPSCDNKKKEEQGYLATSQSGGGGGGDVVTGPYNAVSTVRLGGYHRRD
jgi:tubulin epsilon